MSPNLPARKLVFLMECNNETMPKESNLSSEIATFVLCSLMKVDIALKCQS